MRSVGTTLLAAALTSLAVADVARAASPALQQVLPRGGQRGTEVDLVLAGDRLADAQELLVFSPGITVTKVEPAADGKSAKAHIAIAPDARLGEYAVRVRTASGISDLRTFYVGALPSIEEVEPNTEFEKPQKIDLNVTVVGVIKSEDVDYYVITAKQGQRITAEIEGMRLASAVAPFDPYIAILDQERFELTSSDDSALLLQDPVASLVAPKDGNYIIEVRESSYGGSEAGHYRLHVGTFPRPRAAFPLGGQVGQPLSVELLGDVAGPIAHSLTLPAEPNDKHAIFAEQNGQIAPSPNTLRVSPFPNVLEAEPNNEPSQATAAPVELPLALNGVISTGGDVDVYRIKAKKDQPFDVNVFARRVRSPLDPVLTISDATGTQIAANDDSGGPDSYLRWAAPADGEYTLRVTDHLRNGGPAYAYRVEIAAVEPKVTVSLPVISTNSQERLAVAVPRGNRYATLIRATRADFGGDLTIAPAELPEGVTATCDTMPAGVDVVPVVFEAAPTAPIGGKLIDVVARPAPDPNVPLKSRFEQAIDMVYVGNNQSYYQARVQKLAVAVTEESPFKLSLVQPKVPIVQNGSMQLKVVAERKEGFKAPITVQMLFNPPGIGAGPVTIPEGQNEILLPINAAGDAQARKWKICVIGSSDAGGSVGGPLWVSSQLIDLDVAAPMLAMKIEMASAEQGKGAPLLCTIEPKTKFDGPAKVQLVGLPAEAKAEEKQITAADTQVVFDVTTGPKTPVGQHKAVFCVVTVMKDGEPIVHNVGHGGVLRVDAPPPKDAAAKAPEPAPTTKPAAPMSRLEKLRQEAKARKAEK
jgi:hypothetical protein